jgi:hypothetical protein
VAAGRRHAYLRAMPRRIILIALLMLAAISVTAPAQAQSADDERYNIMRPEPTEPWLPPKYVSPRGSNERMRPLPPAPMPPAHATIPPPVYVPQTGQLLPNLPTVSGAGPGGAETSQDRAVRCAHQAGMYGAAAGDRNAYIGSCFNQ